MNKITYYFKKAFPKTIPVLVGYTFLGMAYGLLMTINGEPIWISLFMSIIVFAGSLQFIAVTLLSMAFNPLNAFFISLMINVRHLFYSISMLEKYKVASRLKIFLIFTLTDETFSILCHDNIKNEEKKYYYFTVSLLNYIYWCLATVIGSILGYLINFNTKGIDFILTALFVVMFLEQWLASENKSDLANEKENDYNIDTNLEYMKKKHFASIVGILASIASLFLFGEKMFIIFAMLIMLIVFSALYIVKSKTNKERTQ